MAVLTRVTDFVPSTLIKSQEVDDELNQLVNLLSGVSTNKDTLLKFSDGTNPVLRVDQLGAGVIQQWLQNGTVKSRINNNGSLESIAGPVVAASQTITAPLTIDGTPDIVLKANGFITGYAKCIRNARPGVGNVGAGLDTLESFDLPVGNLATNGDFAKAYYTISLNSNDNDKRIVVTVGGTAVLDTTLRDLDALGAIIEVTASRVSSTSVDVGIITMAGNLFVASTPALTASVGFAAEAEFNNFAVSDLGSNVLNFLVQAEATSNNDVVLFISQMFVTQMT